MKVGIKDLKVEMEIKNSGIEIEVCDNDGKHVGDLYISKTGLIWCQGKTQRKNGHSISWNKFIDSVEKGII